MIEQVLLKLCTSADELAECSVAYPNKPPWFIEFSNARLGSRTFYANDLFDCLCELRIFLEKNGFLILCNGARVDAYPSTMSREMSGGRKVYILKIGEKANLESLVHIFAEAPRDKVGTVNEQADYYKRFIEGNTSK